MSANNYDVEPETALQVFEQVLQSKSITST